MSTGSLPWNHSDQSDVYGSLDLKKGGSSVSVHAELDDNEGRLSWYERTSKRIVGFKDVNGRHSSRAVKVDDLKTIRRLVRDPSGLTTVGHPNPLGSIRLGNRAHLECRSDEDDEDAADALERSSQGGAASGAGSHPPAHATEGSLWSLRVTLGRSSAVLVAPSEDTFRAWRAALSARVGAVNADRGSAPFGTHRLYACGACERLSAAANARAAENERRGALR